MKRLQFLAGYRALAKIRDSGLLPQDVRMIPGAAGGPKWLILSHLDRAIFGDWLKNSPAPVDLIGVSTGAWRFAALAQNDPVSALDRFEDVYIHQRRWKPASTSEISRNAETILEACVSPEGVRQILAGEKRRLHVITARCRHLTGSASGPLAGAAYAGAVAVNIVSRNLLGYFFKRVIYHHPGAGRLFPERLLDAEYVPLTGKNILDILVASESVPFVMEPVLDPPDAPPGNYRNGGLVDYHMDLPYDLDEGGIVLFPHFAPNVIPGWLDKFLLWRNGSPENLRDVVIVCPTDEFVESLPMEKIPDRTDFKTFSGRDSDRIRHWEETIVRCRELADEFMEAVGSGSIRDEVESIG